MIKNILWEIFSTFFPFSSLTLKYYKLLLPIVAVIVFSFFVSAVYVVSSLLSWVF